MATSVFDDFKNPVALNSDYPMSPMYHCRNLLKKMVEDETNRPRVSACREDNRMVVIDDIIVNVSNIGDMFQGLLNDIQDNERAITKDYQKLNLGFKSSSHISSWTSPTRSTLTSGLWTSCKMGFGACVT